MVRARGPSLILPAKVTLGSSKQKGLANPLLSVGRAYRLGQRTLARRITVAGQPRTLTGFL